MCGCVCKCGMWLCELTKEAFFFMPNKTAHANAAFLSLRCQYLGLGPSFTEGGDCDGGGSKTGLTPRFTHFSAAKLTDFAPPPLSVIAKRSIPPAFVLTQEP